ncbi:MAG: transglycosylase SLT domain-containing protein, partial [bacterium]
LTNDNAVMPTGDPGIKPVELLSWAKDFKSSNVPYRIPGFESKDSNKNPTVVLPASNPVNCSGVSFDKNVKEFLNKYMDPKIHEKVKNIAANFYYNNKNKKTKDLLQQNYGSFEAFVDNLYTIIRRESSGNPLASNTKNGNGTWDCGLVQINTRYAGGDYDLLKKYNEDLYNQLYNSNDYKTLKKGSKEEICRVLQNNVDLNLALGISLLVANLN